MATDFSNTANPLTAAAALSADKSGAPPVINNHALFTRVYNLQEQVSTLEGQADDLVGNGVVAWSRLDYTDNPTHWDKLEIGGDVYQFVDEGTTFEVEADANIGVVIEAAAADTFANLVIAINNTNDSDEHATLLQTDGTTPALARGTENVVASITGGILYLYAADAPGGTKVAGTAPNLAVTAAGLTEAIEFVPTNLNLTVGSAYDPATKQLHTKHAVVAGDLTATQPIPVPVPFVPQSWNVQVRSAAGELKPDAYCAVTVPAAINGQNFLGLNIKPTAPTVTKRATLDVPLVDNDISIATLFLGIAHDIRAISYSCGEDPASTLVVDISKVTASTAGDAVALTTAEDLAGGTQAGQVTALDLDEAGGDIPIAMTALQALLFTVTAGNGTVAPRSVTFYVDYVELAVATDVLMISVFGA